MTETNTTILTKDRLFKRCPVCLDAALMATSEVLPEGPLLKCASCGQFLSSCTSAQHDAALWKWDVAGGTEPGARSAARYRKVSERRLTTSIKLLHTGSPSPHLLDVGCSSGSLLTVASNIGLSVSGVEPAALAAETAQKNGFNVYAGYLHQAAYPSDHFDIVTLFEIVEHLSDPASLIAECRRVLKPGGILAINTPNAASWTAKFMGARWEGFSLTGLGGHASFFTPGSMRSLARVSRLQIAKTETRNVRFYEKGQCHPAVFRAAKILAQLLAFPARIFGQGHDLLVFMRKEA